MMQLVKIFIFLIVRQACYVIPVLDSDLAGGNFFYINQFCLK